jgi:predicted double-glycine peptidase
MPARAGILLALFVTAASAASPGWLEVPFVRQRKNGCGPAVAEMVMRYWGIAQADQLAGGSRGLSAAALREHFVRHGFHAFAVQGRRQDLEDHLAKGRPLIVALKETSTLHYAVVAGLDESNVYLNDPARHKLARMSWEDFDAFWRAAGNWILIAVPRRL